MENGYVKIPIHTYDMLKEQITSLQEHVKVLESREMRSKLQNSPSIQIGTIKPDKVQPYKIHNPWFHD